MSKSITEHQDRLIEETFALLQLARDEQPNTALPVVPFGTVETKVAVAKEHSHEQTASATASLVEVPAASEQAPSPTAAVSQPIPHPPHPLQTFEDLQQDCLIIQTLSMVQTVSIVEPKPPISPSLLRPAANVPSQKERLDMERADMRRRVAVFKEIQQRFQREREEYYAATMANARANEWDPRAAALHGCD